MTEAVSRRPLSLSAVASVLLGSCNYSRHLKRGLLVSPQRRDALIDHLCFFLQISQVILEPGDLLLFGPEARPKGRMSTATAAPASVVAAMMSPVPATLVALMFATHAITSFHWNLAVSRWIEAHAERALLDHDELLA